MADAASTMAEERRRRFVPVLAVELDIASRFVATVLHEGAPAGVVEIGPHHVYLEAVTAAEPDDVGWKGRLRQADAVVVLVHFLDHRLLDAASSFIREATMVAVPTAVFIYRAEAERQFKISCDCCGQKLWVMEEEVGRRGRCAGCREPMLIVAPAERVRARLQLPDTIPVLNVVERNVALCRGALANLLVRVGLTATAEEISSSREFLKRATVPIQIPHSLPPDIH